MTEISSRKRYILERYIQVILSATLSYIIHEATTYVSASGMACLHRQV